MRAKRTLRSYPGIVRAFEEDRPDLRGTVRAERGCVVIHRDGLAGFALWGILNEVLPPHAFANAVDRRDAGIEWTKTMPTRF